MNGAQNWGPFQGGNNWMNNTDFGLKFDTKNSTDTKASGAADGSASGTGNANASGKADAYAKGAADGFAKGQANAYAKGYADAMASGAADNNYRRVAAPAPAAAK
jgi:flagellar biosynthesis/type III secretory pathway protein FliH